MPEQYVCMYVCVFMYVYIHSKSHISDLKLFEQNQFCVSINDCIFICKSKSKASVASTALDAYTHMMEFSAVYLHGIILKMMAHLSGICHGTAILIIIEDRFQVFQRFSSSTLVLKTVGNRLATLNYYENGSSLCSFECCTHAHLDE